MLREYEAGHGKVRAYVNSIKAGEDYQDYYAELEISSDMSSEMRENISEIRRNCRRELYELLRGPAGAALTDRQLEAMTLRAEGLTMDGIGSRLGISKAAVYKLIKKSEQRIDKMLQ